MKEPETAAMTQLATRITAALHRRLKLHCVQQGTSVMAFVEAAITEALERSRKKK